MIFILIFKKILVILHFKTKTMSKKVKFPTKKSLFKEINGNRVYIGKGCDIVHGKGWFCHIYDEHGRVGFGYDKKNIFSVYKKALVDIK